MSTELPKDLIHLECSRKSLDQHGPSDRSGGNAQVGLREVEDVRPKTSFKVVLHFGQIVIGTASMGEEIGGVVEEVKGKVEDGAGNGLVVNEETGFVKMPSSGSKLWGL